MSWKPEVTEHGKDEWYGNGLNFATEDEARAYVEDLFMCWMAVANTRVVEVSDLEYPVNCKWVGGQKKIEEVTHA